MTHLSLFSGIGGIDLAAHWAGFSTVAFVERDEFCQKVLAKNFPGVPIYNDVTTFDAKSFRGRTALLSGGFPCQPFSNAGKRRGKEDDRHLWPHMLRVVAEARPTFVLGENVAGFVGMALDDCLADLEAQGYEALAFVLPACAVNAPHRRDRCFIVATSLDDSVPGRHLFGEGGIQAEQDQDGQEDGLPGETGVDVADADKPAVRITERNQGRGERVVRDGWWTVEPNVGRVANGVPRRVDRLRALGNAVVPAQVYPILKAIADCLPQTEGSKERSA